MSPARRRFVPRADPLEGRTAPASLRLLPLPGGVSGFGTAGADPNNPSRNSELAPSTELTVPFGPRELGEVFDQVRVGSAVTLSANAPAGLFPILGAAVPAGRLVFDLSSTAVKPGGVNGGGTTVFTYGLDPNVVLAPLLLEVVPGPGEQAGQEVQLSFGFQATAAPGAASTGGVQQDASFTHGGSRVGLLSRNVPVGQPAPPLAGGRDLTVRIGAQVQLEFTQAVTLAGLGPAGASARMTLGIAVGSATSPPTGAGVVGADRSGGPVVQVYARDGALTQSLQAFEPGFGGGVRVAVADLDGDRRADLLAGSGPGTVALVTAYLGAGVPADGPPPAFRDFAPFPGFTGGVFVG